MCRTSEAVEKVSSSSMLLPTVTFCINDPYKNDVLREKGLPDGFFFGRHARLKYVRKKYGSVITCPIKEHNHFA